jgi:hypothetical protein
MLTDTQKFEIGLKLDNVTNLEEAKKLWKMLHPEATEEQIQRWAEEIISIQ